MKSFALALAVLTACFESTPDDPVDPPPASCDPAVRAEKLVTVSGTVVDFVTNTPVAGATVDVGTTFDGTAEACPVEASLTSRADGTFGPVEVALGSTTNPVFVMFRVHGEGLALTASDNRTCDAASCTLDHTIAAVSKPVADAWRAELAAGGMPNAARTGLVAFEFRNPDGTGAESVVPEAIIIGEDRRFLVPGSEVRFVDTDRRALLPAAASFTSASGLALASIPHEIVFIGGKRDELLWQPTGCTIEPGTIFLEGRTQGQ
jgi:hypothetical protein